MASGEPVNLIGALHLDILRIASCYALLA